MKSPWLKFFPADWQSDTKVRLCSLAERGLWIEMLCIMHSADPQGYLVVNGNAVSDEDLARLVGAPPKEVRKIIARLEDIGVFSRNQANVIYSRRMLRDLERADVDQANGKSGGNPHIRRGTVPKDQRVRPYKRTDAPAKTKRIFERDHGRCHWCKVELLFEGEGGEPNLFHVDHVVPICDGGTHDEGNLVAACADCNHKRKLKSWEPPPDPNGGVGVGRRTDSNPHIPEARGQNPEANARGNKSNIHSLDPPDGVAPRPFPADGSIAFSPFATIARERGRGLDVDLLASAFRQFCRQHEIPLDQASIERSFGTFCERHRVRGAA